MGKSCTVFLSSSSWLSQRETVVRAGHKGKFDKIK